jgi:hypothetical protein
LATRQASFTADKTHSDDEVVWDDDDEDDDAGSSADAEGSSATYSDDESEELEDQGESLSHSSKSPGPSSLRDWSKDDDDELGTPVALGEIALHVATAAAVGGKTSPIVEVPDSPEQPPATLKPAAPKPVAPEGAGSGAVAAKKRSQPAPPEPTQKRKKAELAAIGLLPPKVKKVIKRQATAVAG